MQEYQSTQLQYPRFFSPSLWSSSFKTMLESLRKIEQPLAIFSIFPSAITPAFRNLAFRVTNFSSAILRRISFRMRPRGISLMNDFRSTATAHSLPFFTPSLQIPCSTILAFASPETENPYLPLLIHARGG